MARVFRRMGRFVGLYCGLHTAGWLLAYPLFGFAADFSFWAYMGTGMVVLATLGGLTMLVTLSAALNHTRMPVEKFRWRLWFTMAGFTVPLWLTIWFAPLAFFECVVAALFTTRMPAPLIPENWTARPQ
ncbi:hypothetical protein [Streptomyces sp. NPDC001717]|uniref:hypothetical protein n=1 Tax=Streptomyces sp. NPDC001717 TaxID=3364604 RepID=UPI0036D0A522